MNNIPLTKAVRRQIYTTDIALVTATVHRESNKDLPRKTLRVIDRITKRIQSINTVLYGGGKNDFYNRLSDKDYKRYLKGISKLKAFLEKTFEDDKVELDYYNAVLYVLEETQESTRKSKNKQLKHEWLMLVKSFGTFCAQVIDEPDGIPGLKFPCDKREYNHRDANGSDIDMNNSGSPWGNGLKGLLPHEIYRFYKK